MLNTNPRRQEALSWTWVLLWTVVIYLTIPVARELRGFVKDHYGTEIFLYVVSAVALLAFFAAVVSLVRSKVRSKTGYLWLTFTAGVFLSYTYSLRANPVEAMHFVQYGVLSALIYRAFAHRTKDITIYFSSAVLGAIIGTVDEAIQWITPDRFWALRDIWLNFMAVALIQLAIWKGLRPPAIAARVEGENVRGLVRLTGVLVVLVGGSLLNTPACIGWYAERFNVLSFLITNESVMAEYGYLYEDPDIGIFRSRLSPEALKDYDEQHQKRAAAILDQYQRGEMYSTFLRKYTPVTDAFLHETRVHLFRRDRYLRKGKALVDDKEQYKYRLTVAYYENQILEKYFGNTLRHSNYILAADDIALLRSIPEADTSYESAVSKRLFTSINEREVIAAFALILVGLTLADLRLKSRHVPHHEESSEEIYPS